MNKIILAISLASIMMGCSTVYKTGQTIDDVYFSPARPGAEYVNIEEKEEYRASEVPMTDRYMRMKAFGGSRWNSFDDDYMNGMNGPAKGRKLRDHAAQG